MNPVYARFPFSSWFMNPCMNACMISMEKGEWSKKNDEYRKLRNKFCLFFRSLAFLNLHILLDVGLEFFCFWLVTLKFKAMNSASACLCLCVAERNLKLLSVFFSTPPSGFTKLGHTPFKIVCCCCCFFFWLFMCRHYPYTHTQTGS